jgi:hypothetical protein
LDFVRRPDGTPVDPEVVTQFNCLQQTGNFCPATSNAASAMTSTTTISTGKDAGLGMESLMKNGDLASSMATAARDQLFADMSAKAAEILL